MLLDVENTSTSFYEVFFGDTSTSATDPYVNLQASGTGRERQLQITASCGAGAEENQVRPNMTFKVPSLNYPPPPEQLARFYTTLRITGQTLVDAWVKLQIPEDPRPS